MNHHWIPNPIPPGQTSVLETCQDCSQTSLRFKNGSRMYRGRNKGGCCSPEFRERRRKELAREIDWLVEFWEGEA